MVTLINVGSGDIRENMIIGTLNVSAPPTLQGVDPLRPHVAYEAMHDSGEVDAQGDCHPGTRIAVQEVIKRWAGDRHPNSLVNLMIGAAGAGKSAIMRTIAKALEEEGRLLGGFFCFRSSKRRNDGSLVIPTLAAQIVKRIPHLRPLVHKAFEEDEGLLTKAMDIQALKLIIEPLNSIDPNELPQRPYIVLLDGLDEINGVAAQQAIIKVLAYINRYLVSPLHFLVASRPEPPILQAFDEFLSGLWAGLELDDSFKPNDDIDIFYTDHFQNVCDRNSQLPVGWPGVPVKRILVTKGSGQFIFASVVVSVIGNPSSTLSPQERLDLVLEVTKRDDLRPLERLDLLYVTVLNQIPEADRPQVLHILSVILAAGNTLRSDLRPTPRFFDALFCCAAGITRHRLCHLHSVLKIPADDGNAISPHHATLGDFIFDKDRSEKFGFHVDKTQLVEETVVQIALALLSNSQQMTGVFDDFLIFFNIQIGNLGQGSITLKLAEKIQSYDQNLSSLSPLALITFAAPVALQLQYSRHLSFHFLSNRIIAEAHRRARLYYTDYGKPAVTLLAFSAMTMRTDSSYRFTTDSDIWNGLCALWIEGEKSTTLSMDRTSGLGVSYMRDHPARAWTEVWARNKWLSSYLHLLAQSDFVADIARLRKSPNCSTLVSYWRHALSFDQSTVSALRATLFPPRQERVDEDLVQVLFDIQQYIHKYWESRWRVPSLILLHWDCRNLHREIENRREINRG